MNSTFQASINGTLCGHPHVTFQDAFDMHATQNGGNADFITEVKGDRVTYAMSSMVSTPQIKIYVDGHYFGILGSSKNPSPQYADFLLTVSYENGPQISTWHRHGIDAVRVAEKLAQLAPIPF